ESAIKEIATAGGTTLDLLIILDYLRKKWGHQVIPEKDVQSMIFAYVAEMYRAAGLDKVWPDGRTDDAFRQATYPVLAARCQKSKEDYNSRPTEWVGMASLNDVFNDINIGEFLSLSIAIRQGIASTTNNPRFREALIEAEGRLNLYDFKLFFGSDITDAAK